MLIYSKSFSKLLYQYKVLSHTFTLINLSHAITLVVSFSILNTTFKGPNESQYIITVGYLPSSFILLFKTNTLKTELWWKAPEEMNYSN